MDKLLYQNKLYSTIYEIIKICKMSKTKAYYLMQMEAIKRIDPNNILDEPFFTIPNDQTK